MFTYFITFFLPLTISIIIIPILIKLSKKFQLFDKPSLRKIHKKPVSRLGGVGIFISFILTFYLFSLTKKITFISIPNQPIYFLMLLLSFAVGFADDLFTLRVRYKLLAQIIIAFITSLSGLMIQQITILNSFTIKFGPFSHIITIIWIVSFMNAINFTDGLDGLASGIVIISSIFLFIISILTGNITVVYIILILLGSVIGFYVYNFPPANIFMGDGGSYFLGYMYATIGLMGVQKSTMAIIFIVPIVFMLIPIIDILNVICIRIKNKKNIFLPDNNHLHYKLLSLGLSIKNILTLMYFITFILGIFGFLIFLFAKEHSFILFILIFLVTFFSFYIIYLVEKYILGLKNRNNSKLLKSKNTDLKN